MAVEFRCEKCGKLLSVDADRGAKVKCQYCGAKVALPAGLASLPRPQVPPGAGPPPPPPPAGGPQPEEEQLEQGAGQEALMDTMARMMPWVISLFLHAGIIVIMAFISIMMNEAKADDGDIVIPNAQLAKKPGGQLNPGKLTRPLRKTIPTNQQKWTDHKTTLDTDVQSKQHVRLYAHTGGATGGSPGDFGQVGGGEGKGPHSTFFGEGGDAYHIVLIVDRSGSMLDYFDMVVHQMLATLGKLKPEQTFHVVLFARGTADENPPRQLVYANNVNRAQAYEFLKKVTASGGSPTNPLAAIKRGFEVLASPPNKLPGKLMFLLTDGEFHDNQEVRRQIKSWNKRGDVLVNTILFAAGGEEIRRTLEQIARENGGQFKFEERSE